MPLLIYSAIICSLHFLFQKEEISFLFTLPVKRVQIFEAKFLETFYKSSWVAFCGILTFIIAIQTYFDISPLIYLGTVIASIAYLLIFIAILFSGKGIFLLLNNYFTARVRRDYEIKVRQMLFDFFLKRT